MVRFIIIYILLLQEAAACSKWWLYYYCFNKLLVAFIIIEIIIIFFEFRFSPPSSVSLRLELAIVTCGNECPRSCELEYIIRVVVSNRILCC